MFKKIGIFFKKIYNTIKDFLFKNRYGTIMVLVGLIVAFWDLTLKFLLDGKYLTGVKGFFNIYSTHNTGGAWSIFSNSTVILICVSIIFIIALIVFNFILKKKNYFYAISMGLLLSGALCNLYDRIALGYVRDFINLEFINFPVFNIADIAITTGVILLCIYFIILLPKQEKKLSEKQNNIKLNDKSNNEKAEHNNDTSENILDKKDKNVK